MTVQPLTLKTITSPITADLDSMSALFGLHPARIRQLAADGVIRRVKLGDAMQAPTVYFVRDLEEHLAALAAE